MDNECETEYGGRFHFAGDVASECSGGLLGDGKYIRSVLAVPCVYTMTLMLSPLLISKNTLQEGIGLMPSFIAINL